MTKDSDSSYLSKSVETVKNVAVEHVGDRVDQMSRTADHLVMDTERFIVRNPWRAVGIAAGIGLIAGSLIALAPRSSRDK